VCCRLIKSWKCLIAKIFLIFINVENSGNLLYPFTRILFLMLIQFFRILWWIKNFKENNLWESEWVEWMECVCVCVCMWEREGEGVGEWNVCVCVCVCNLVNPTLWFYPTNPTKMAISEMRVRTFLVPMRETAYKSY